MSKRTLLAAACIAVVLVNAALVFAATGESLVRLPGHVPAALQQATRLPGVQLAAGTATDAEPHAVGGGSTITVTVVLNRSDQAGFDRYLREVQDPRSARHRQWLDQAELARRFGPSPEAYQKVLAYLERSGFTLIEGSANRLTLTVQGTRTQAERAFGVEIHDYRLDRRTFYANDGDPALPAELAPHVQAVVGLSNLARPRPLSEALEKALCWVKAVNACRSTPDDPKTPHYNENVVCRGFEYLVCITPSFEHYGSPPDPGPPPDDDCEVPDECEPDVNASLQAAKPTLSKAAAAPVRWLDVDGAGQVVGLLQFDSFNPTDIADYLAHVKLPASYMNRLSRVPVNGGAPLGANEAEVLLDILMVLPHATGANVVVYDAPFTGRNTSFQTLFNRMVNDGVTVISNSWAYCEDQTTPADVQSIDAILATAAASGISVFNASGDTGSTCLNGSPNTIAVPAGSPNATAVGGTSLTGGPARTYVSETWWDGVNDDQPTGQGGFGVSRFFSRPAYQNGLTSSPMRSIPDVASNADPAKGVFICQASGGGCPTGLQYGGTSIAAPTWAAFAALLNHAQGQNLGNLNPLLYPLAGTDAFHTPASMGSDFAHVGLGSPNLNRIHLALLGQVAGPVSAAVSQVEATGNRIPADGTETFVVVRLRDADGNSVSGKTVSLSAGPGPQVTITPATPDPQPQRHHRTGGRPGHGDGRAGGRLARSSGTGYRSSGHLQRRGGQLQRDD